MPIVGTLDTYYSFLSSLFCAHMKLYWIDVSLNGMEFKR
jgi:hypothetical protein